MSLLRRLARALRRGGAPAQRVTALAARPSPAGSLCFLYRGDLAGCRYVSENTVAALSGGLVEAVHRLELFDGEGRPVQVVEERSRRPFVCLTPSAGALPLGWVRVSVAVDPERLGPEATALLRQLPAPGRAFLQLRREASGAWESVRGGDQAGPPEAAVATAGGSSIAKPSVVELVLSPVHSQSLALLNPADRPVLVMLTIQNGSASASAASPPSDLEVGALPPELPASLELPPWGVRLVQLPAREGTLRLRIPQLARESARPQGLLEPLEPGTPWRALPL